MNQTLKQSAPVVITAILAIAAIEIYALSQGINGLLMTGVVGVIAAIVGVKAGSLFERRSIAKKQQETSQESSKFPENR